MGLPWKGGAISNGKWSGVWLNDIIDIPKNKKFINVYDYNERFSISLPFNRSKSLGRFSEVRYSNQ